MKCIRCGVEFKRKPESDVDPPKHEPEFCSVACEDAEPPEVDHAPH